MTETTTKSAGGIDFKRPWDFVVDCPPCSAMVGDGNLNNMMMNEGDSNNEEESIGNSSITSMQDDSRNLSPTAIRKNKLLKKMSQLETIGMLHQEDLERFGKMLHQNKNYASIQKVEQELEELEQLRSSSGSSSSLQSSSSSSSDDSSSKNSPTSNNKSRTSPTATSVGNSTNMLNELSQFDINKRNDNNNNNNRNMVRWGGDSSSKLKKSTASTKISAAPPPPELTQSHSNSSSSSTSSILQPHQIQNDLDSDQIEELFVEMCFFARLGFVQPPCCLKCTYEESMEGKRPNRKCSRFVVWRKDAQTLLHPNFLDGNILLLQCHAARSLLVGKTVENHMWDKLRKQVIIEL